jgi:hypothetical protein
MAEGQTLKVIDVKPAPYILLEGDLVVKQIFTRGIEAAVAELKPNVTQRVALVLDIPR